MTDFHNTGWDPYQELQMAKHNIGQLIHAHNHSHQLLTDLLEQHAKLLTLATSTRLQVDLLHQQVSQLTSQKSL